MRLTPAHIIPFATQYYVITTNENVCCNSYRDIHTPINSVLPIEELQKIIKLNKTLWEEYIKNRNKKPIYTNIPGFRNFIDDDFNGTEPTIHSLNDWAYENS